MIAELFMNNAFNLTVILSCCAALVLMSVWYHRGERRCKGFIFHAAQFFVYAIIIGTFGSIANNVIESYSLKFISPSVVDFICTSLIALILTIKLFLVINQFEKDAD
ncbi:Mechanosensitive ion channel [Citrobacter freundii]|uniref:Mechanosensitive ion channel n=1 Tax=Citrobacter freundii TaxID=546 RepID=A0A7G2IVT7_CITFR|nr:Mechanosensitive ion channel [Citrobacter freundii]